MVKKLISIICPVFNEENNISIFYGRVQKALFPVSNRYKFEFIFTNNRSTDNTYDLIRQLHKKDKRVQLITFSRNFGYQASVSAGLFYAHGDASVIIDVDCEDPPELIPQFIEKWEAGYNIIYGIRRKRRENFFVQRTRNLFYWFLNKMGDNEIIMNMAEFSLIDKDVRQEILKNKSTFPFLRTEIGYAGFNRFGIDYIRQVRQYGKTHYNFLGMVQFAIGGILSSSTYLLRLSAFLGAILMPFNLLCLILDIYNTISKGFEILITVDLMYLVFFISVLSIYTARIYKDGVQRPIFIVDWKYSIFNKSPKKERRI